LGGPRGLEWGLAGRCQLAPSLQTSAPEPNQHCDHLGQACGSFLCVLGNGSPDATKTISSTLSRRSRRRCRTSGAVKWRLGGAVPVLEPVCSVCPASSGDTQRFPGLSNKLSGHGYTLRTKRASAQKRDTRLHQLGNSVPPPMRHGDEEQLPFVLH
jgi:hypothetical protein